MCAFMLCLKKNRLTQWKEKEKFRPALPFYLIQKRKYVKRVKNKYYREKKIGSVNKETRELFGILTQKVSIKSQNINQVKGRHFYSELKEYMIIQTKHFDHSFLGLYILR
jgi:hypothetical protein